MKLCIDIGNVICHVDFKMFLDKLTLLLKDLNNNSIDPFQFLKKTQKYHDLGIVEMADSICEFLPIQYGETRKELIDKWNETIRPNYLMIEFLMDLLNGKDPTKIALLSNIGIEHSQVIRNILTPDIYDRCDKFFSCDVGARKPSYLYFKTFLEMYPDYKGSLYVDDRAENLKTGELFGLEPFHFDLDTYKSDKEISDKIEKMKRLIDIY